MKSRDHRRFQANGYEISSDFIAIPFVARIYLSRLAIATYAELQATIMTSEKSQSPCEICRDLLQNSDLLSEIRHDLESEDRSCCHSNLFVGTVTSLVLISDNREREKRVHRGEIGKREDRNTPGHFEFLILLYVLIMLFNNNILNSTIILKSYICIFSRN